MRRPLVLVTLMASLLAGGSRSPRAAGTPKPQRPVQIIVDIAEPPQAKAWAEKAKALCEKWYPIIADYLRTEGDTPPQTVKLVFKKKMGGVAGTSGATILISARWITDHADDIGLVIHELTHVVQRGKDLARVALARLNFDFTSVRAPIDGTIGLPRITPGNLAVADSTVLATIVSADQM